MPVAPFHEFFRDLDRAWESSGTGKIRLPIIGAGALLLQTNYQRLTKDSDVLETAEIDEGLRRQLEKVAGKDSGLHRRRGSAWMSSVLACRYCRSGQAGLRFLT